MRVVSSTFWMLALCALPVVSQGQETGPEDFSQSGVPFLQQHCLECHSGDAPEAGLSLVEFADSVTLIKQRATTERILDALKFGQMPPAEAERPEPTAVDAFLDSTQAILEYADRTAQPDPGRVTMRRLNRTEYSNTVRDLVGIDFNPAEDFPADDIGHGFDNIGDVLSLPPVLMERYLAAAETIAERAITPNAPDPTKRHLATRYAEPAGSDVPDANFRPLTTEDPENGIKSGPFFTRYQVPTGEFIFRTKLYAEAAADQTVQVAILACGPDWKENLATDIATEEQAATLFGPAVNGLKPFRIVETIEVTARSQDQAQQIEVRFGPVAGLDRMAVALVRPVNLESPTKVFIEHLSLEGPLDTRPQFQRRLLAIASDRPAPEQTREIVRQLARQAYRRTPTSEEVERLAGLVQQVESSGDSRDAGLQMALQAMLVSPKFLFRVELDETPTAEARRPLDEFQLASRLSYFLWSTMPDDELLNLAERNELSANLESQVRRMLADPKAISLVDNFALQWLQLKRLETASPDKELFPDFDDRLRRAMLEETRLFVKEIFLQDHNVMDLLGADFTYVNFSLARHYGIDLRQHGIEFEPGEGGRGRREREALGRQFHRIQIQDGSRGGLLTQASILTVTSNPTRTSPVKRGRWILEQMLGTPPPPPPPNVPELEEQKGQLTGTLRERMEQHRANPSCANCHAKMDPIGFAFENFDAVGRYREKDGEFEIEPAGELPGAGTFSGPQELIALLKGRRAPFVRCLTEKMLTYSLGRGLEYYDRPAVNQILRSMEEDGDRFSSLVIAIVESEPFRYRRGK